LEYAISILIPTFNRSRQLSRILDNLALQQLPESVQIVVSDNASSDDSKEMLSAFAASKKLPNLKCIFQDQNIGPLANWKACLKEASARFVHWHWSDDQVDSGFYDAALIHLKEAETVVLFPARYAREEANNVKPLQPLYIPSPRDKRASPNQLLRHKVGRHRLPVSPLAYILPVGACQRVLIDNTVEDDVGIGINDFATGYDDLMILEALLHANKVMIDTTKTVYMMRHDESISMLESGKGNHIRYAYARLAWCKARGFFSFGVILDCARLIVFGHLRALSTVLLGNPFRPSI